VEANPVETEAIVERQEIPKEEAAVHTTRSWQKETVACQEKTEARLECKEPNQKKMESEVEGQEVPVENAVEKPVRGWKKRQRGRNLDGRPRREPKQLTRGDCSFTED
jgi:hypothetical protein